LLLGSLLGAAAGIADDLAGFSEPAGDFVGPDADRVGKFHGRNDYAPGLVNEGDLEWVILRFHHKWFDHWCASFGIDAGLSSERDFSGGPRGRVVETMAKTPGPAGRR
jgi:hypothetical protein